MARFHKWLFESVLEDCKQGLLNAVIQTLFVEVEFPSPGPGWVRLKAAKYGDYQGHPVWWNKASGAVQPANSDARDAGSVRRTQVQGPRVAQVPVQPQVQQASQQPQAQQPVWVYAKIKSPVGKLRNGQEVAVRQLNKQAWTYQTLDTGEGGSVPSDSAATIFQTFRDPQNQPLKSMMPSIEDLHAKMDD